LERQYDLSASLRYTPRARENQGAMEFENAAKQFIDAVARMNTRFEVAWVFSSERRTTLVRRPV
jgi:hypothetical protein